MAEPQAPTHIDDRAARQNTFVLASCLAIIGSIAPISFAIGGLAGHYLLSEDKTLSTLPITAFVLGTALTAMPAASFMRLVGRKTGFLFGAIQTAIGCLLAVIALQIGSFWLFCLAFFIEGSANAFVQQYRFAAADSASEAFRPKAISWVLGGGVVAAIIGPEAVIHTKDALLPIPFAGAFLSGIVLSIIGLVILLFLRMPHEKPDLTLGTGRTLWEVAIQPKFIVALTCAVVSYGLMNFVMTAAPLAMVEHYHHTVDQSTRGIQMHVVAMFAPSFFTGYFISWFGKERVVFVGMLLLIGTALVGLSGVDVLSFWATLILLGLGWNFGFIGATAMVTDCYTPAERNKVQGLNDAIVFGFVAFSSVMSGSVLNAFGWQMINWIMFPFVGVAMLLLVWQVVSRRREVTL